jgi:hypothetical protein
MDFTGKAQFVACGHLTDTPKSMTYSNVVSCDRMQLAFLITGLNELDLVLAGNTTNAYLNAPCWEEIWFKGKIETGADTGKVMVLANTGPIRAQVVETLHDLGYTSTKAAPDVWIKSMLEH